MAQATQQRRGGAVVSLVKFGIGGAGGVLLNDLWEINRLPGYFQTLTTIGNIGIGVDDLLQTAIGAVLAIIPPTREAGLGVIAGTWFTKLGEIYNFPHQIIPHTVTAFTGYAGGSNNSEYFGFPASASTNSAGSYYDPYADAMVAVGD